MAYVGAKFWFVICGISDISYYFKCPIRIFITAIYISRCLDMYPFIELEIPRLGIIDLINNIVFDQEDKINR